MVIEQYLQKHTEDYSETYLFHTNPSIYGFSGIKKNGYLYLNNRFVLTLDLMIDTKHIILNMRFNHILHPSMFQLKT